jgi:signal transduction histidine kinase
MDQDSARGWLPVRAGQGVRRLFFQLYLLICALLMAALGLTVQLLRPTGEDVWAEQLTALAEFDAAATRLMVRASTPEARDKALNELHATFGSDVALVPRTQVMAHLDAAKRDRFARGEAITEHANGKMFLYAPVPAEPFVVRLGPVTQPEAVFTWKQLVPLALLASLAVGMIALLRPLERQLSVLTSAAERLGDGDLHARARLPEESTMGALAATFDRMADQLQTLIASQQDLLHAVSHELRTPLQRLRFGVDLLQGAPDDLPARVHDLQGDITELDTLVDELLSWTRLQGGEASLNREATDLDELLDDLVYDTKRLRNHVRIHLDEPGLPLLVLDPARTRRSIGNLVSNAARYCNGEVRISAHLTDDWVTVDIDDDGIGVPGSDRERIFEPFVRLDDARARDTGGIGLGLAISRQIAQSHGGTLTVHTSDLGGARFRWRIPAEQHG